MSHARSKARRCAVQALYQWQVNGGNVGEIYNQFLVEQNMAKVDEAYFKALLSGVSQHLDELDETLKPHLDRDINSVDPVERAVLRLGAYELIHRLDVPYRVCINEALEAAKMFGAEQGHRYVNGILDKVAQKSRELEVARARKK